MKLISVRLDELQIVRLNEMSAKSGTSKSDIIRGILNRFFNSDQVVITTPRPGQPPPVTARFGDPFDPNRINYHRNELVPEPLIRIP